MSAALAFRGFDVSGKLERPLVRGPAERPEEEQLPVLPPLGYLIEVSVEGERRPLRQPVKYELEQEGEHVTAFAPALLLHGSGRTAQEAEQALARAIVDVWREFEAAGFAK